MSPPQEAEPSEQTPLLGGSQDAPPPETPLPKLQIFLLSLSRVAEPLGFAILFPFVNSMVLDTGEISAGEVGYYVGWIESLFSLVQMVFLIPWGWAADKYGRKPVLIISLLGASASTILFGFSTKIWHMVLFRCLGGIFGGSAVVVRTLFAEFSDSTNQARAFSFFAFASNVGLFLGPVIGGTFALPETQFPSTLGRIPLLREYPYALPCLVAGIYQLLTVTLDAILLREPARKNSKKKEDPGLRALLTPDVLKSLLVFGVAMLLGLAYTAVLPLWLFTPVPLGGLAFTPSYIAAFIALGGFSQSLWLLLAMPPLDKRFGTYRLLRLCFLFWPWLFVAPVIANRLALADNWPGVYTLAALMHTVGSGIAIAFTSSQLIINNVAPPAHLAAVNGLALTLNSGIRTIAPAAFTALFAVGVEKHILGRYLVWAVLFAIGAIGYVISAFAPKESVRKTGVGEGERERQTEGDAENAASATASSNVSTLVDDGDVRG